MAKPCWSRAWANDCYRSSASTATTSKSLASSRSAAARRAYALPNGEGQPAEYLGFLGNRFRRVSPVAPRPREGPLAEPTPAVQPGRRELVFMPPQQSSLSPVAAVPVGVESRNSVKPQSSGEVALK